MALKNLSIIRDKLLDEGRNLDEPVAVIQDASLPKQKVLETTLSKVVEDVNLYKIESPSIVVIGPVVNLRSLLERSVIKDVE
jgi:uroporphyrin-III C-methyltransferase